MAESFQEENIPISLEIEREEKKIDGEDQVQDCSPFTLIKLAVLEEKKVNSDI